MLAFDQCARHTCDEVRHGDSIDFLRNDTIVITVDRHRVSMAITLKRDLCNPHKAFCQHVAPAISKTLSRLCVAITVQTNPCKDCNKSVCLFYHTSKFNIL